MKNQHIKHRLWREAFALAMEKYEELKSNNGTSGAFNYATLGQETEGAAYNPLIVRPTASDYICDIEIAAHRALRSDPLLWSHFEVVYIKQAELPKEIFDLPNFRSMENRVQMRVGKMIHARRLHYITQYFKPKDTR